MTDAPRSHAPRGNASLAALRLDTEAPERVAAYSTRAAERPDLRSHAERGNEQRGAHPAALPQLVSTEIFFSLASDATIGACDFHRGHAAAPRCRLLQFSFAGDETARVHCSPE